jgi:hypothetical protein
MSDARIGKMCDALAGMTCAEKGAAVREARAWCADMFDDYDASSDAADVLAAVAVCYDGGFLGFLADTGIAADIVAS